MEINACFMPLSAPTVRQSAVSPAIYPSITPRHATKLHAARLLWQPAQKAPIVKLPGSGTRRPAKAEWAQGAAGPPGAEGEEAKRQRVVAEHFFFFLKQPGATPAFLQELHRLAQNAA